MLVNQCCVLLRIVLLFGVLVVRFYKFKIKYMKSFSTVTAIQLKNENSQLKGSPVCQMCDIQFKCLA